MAKMKKRFSSSGELEMATGTIYELKKRGKEEEIVEIDLWSFLREFDGKTITISISEDEEVERSEVAFEEESEDEE